MPPRRSGKSKRAAGMLQPTLSFQSQHPNFKPKKPSLLRHSVSATSISASEPDAAASENDASGEVEVTIVEAAPALVVSEDKAKAAAMSAKGELKGQAGKKERRRLDVKSKEWDGLMKAAKAEMGGMKPIHAEQDNNIHHILRVFDMTSKYGPSVGMTRLQRWERAQKWGLNPPEEIRLILTTAEGEDDPSYRENVLHTWL